MLEPLELHQLFKYLDQHNVPLAKTCADFSQAYQGEGFRVLFGLNCLVSSNLLSSLQRLPALYLLGHHQSATPAPSHKSPLLNPFLMQLVSISDSPSTPSYEKTLAFWLLKTQDERPGPDNSLDKNIGVFSPKQLLDMYEASQLDSDTAYVLAPGDHSSEYAKIKAKVMSNYSPPSFANSQINNILLDYSALQDPSTITGIDSERVHAQDVAIQGLGIDFLRPLPLEQRDYEQEESEASAWIREQERLTEECIEPVWLSLSSTPDLGWDYQMCTENNNLTLLKELMQKALVVTLSPHEQKILEDIFDSEGRYLQECSGRSLFAPSQLPDLVEKNPLLASHLLIKLSPSIQIGHYYEKLIKCELTLSSLEVVNRLANAVELPKEFLTFFVSNCIQQCEENKKDRNQQNRLVRLVCVFIRTMIKQKIIHPQDMFIELQAFCIEFNKISEASNLFKQLKSISNNQ